jgi:hypothetical protein
MNEIFLVNFKKKIKLIEGRFYFIFLEGIFILILIRVWMAFKHID